MGFAKLWEEVLVPRSGLACCKGPQPLVFCIDQIGGPVGAGSGEGYWVYFEVEEERT